MFLLVASSATRIRLHRRVILLSVDDPLSEARAHLRFLQSRASLYLATVFNVVCGVHLAFLFRAATVELLNTNFVTGF